MRGIAACVACIGLALVPVAALGEEKAADGIALDAHQKEIIDKVSSYSSWAKVGDCAMEKSQT